MSNVRPFAKRVAAAITTGTPRQQIESIRARRLDLIEEHKRVDGARRPLEEAEAALGRLLDDITASLDIDLSSLSDHRARGLPELLRPATDVGNKINDRLLLALIVASNRSGAREALSKVLRTNYEHNDTMTSSDREAKLNAIDAELFDLEIREEALIRQSEIDGSPILRRDDADPKIVLLRDLAA